MSIPEKISLRLGPLATPMAHKIESTGETPSEYLRRLIAEDCGKQPPEMPEGNPQFRKQRKRKS